MSKPARTFRDSWSLAIVLKIMVPQSFQIVRTFKTSLVPIDHEMHVRSFYFYS